ncbi:MAG: hypothetical protein V4451_21885, partial [Pseudomonadota bacterium]
MIFFTRFRRSERFNGGCRGLSGGKSLFFASPKKSNQKKGDPTSGSLRFASGNLRCSTPAAVQTTRLRLRQVLPALPPPFPLLDPASTGWGMGSGILSVIPDLIRDP